MPFRDAHEMVGSLVAQCAVSQKRLDQIPIDDLKQLSPLFDVDITSVFDVRRSLAARRAIGAPSPANIAAQIKRWRKTLCG
jgi:argininosuccinate lyase